MQILSFFSTSYFIYKNNNRGLSHTHQSNFHLVFHPLLACLVRKILLIKGIFIWRPALENAHLNRIHRDAWLSRKSVRWKDLYETYLCAKFRLYKIIHTLWSIVLKLNGFISIIFFWFQSNGEEKMDDYEIWTYDYSWGDNVCEKAGLAQGGAMPRKRGTKMAVFKVGYFFKIPLIWTEYIEIVHKGSQG